MKTSSEGGRPCELEGATVRPGGLALTDRGVDFCGLAPGDRVLDVGCGVGASVEYLRHHLGFDASGVDASAAPVAEGLARDPSLPLTVASADALPVADQSQDAVLCECVLSLVEDPLQALAEFRRVLRPSGRLVLSDLYARELPPGVERDERSRGVVTRDQLEAWLSASGFDVLFWEDHSDSLREMAAQLILAGGSIEEHYCATDHAGQRPGYYLLVAGAVSGEGSCRG